MKILETTVLPGKKQLIKIPVGQLPSGNTIIVSAHVFRSKKPGPTVLFLAGVHGDEINGMEIIRQAIEGGMFSSLRAGNVIAIPILNTYGFINFSREVPDGKDVNRSFPGTKTGSLASRVAFAIHKHILPLIDFGVDFHTGGRSNYNYPQIRYTHGDEKASQLAEVFGAPLRIAYGTLRKSLRKVALDKHQVPILVFEGGENQRYDGLSIQHGLAGIRRVLQYHKMIPGVYTPKEGLVFNKSTWVRAGRGGLFQWMKSSGNFVKKGEPLGFISDPYGVKPARYIHARADAYIIGHNNIPVVSQGDALFHLASLE